MSDSTITLLLAATTGFFGLVVLAEIIGCIALIVLFIRDDSLDIPTRARICGMCVAVGTIFGVCGYRLFSLTANILREAWQYIIT